MSHSIFALATAPTRSALHVHRVSGNGIFPLLSPFIFSSPACDQPLCLGDLVHGQQGKPWLRHVWLQNAAGEMIDDVVLTAYPCPHSYTGEDLVEISCHGNPFIDALLQGFFRSLGIIDAQPGEFTQRALLNGKLDLLQAEGIHQLISAENPHALMLAQKSVQGILSQETLGIRADMIGILAYLEAHIDFAPEDVGAYLPLTLLTHMDALIERLKTLYQSYESGCKIREGVSVVLCGQPNAGKSSLYNALLKKDRAIVTAIPGTTRDFLEEACLIDGKEFVLFDTAGLRETQDTVEKIGMQRSLACVKTADIVCYLLDSTRITQENISCLQKEIESFFTQETQPKQKFIVVWTKTDIYPKNAEDLVEFPYDRVFISEKMIEPLQKKLARYYDEITNIEHIKMHNSPVLISQRQKDKAGVALSYLYEARVLVEHSDFPEKIASLIYAAKHILEEIVGDIDLEEIFDSVFSSFCIGK